MIINVLSVALGGIAGTVAGDRLSLDFKGKLNMVFGACAVTMGIATIILMVNMSAVIFSVVLGTAIGLAVHLGGYDCKGLRLEGETGEQNHTQK